MTRLMLRRASAVAAVAAIALGGAAAGSATAAAASRPAAGPGSAAAPGTATLTSVRIQPAVPLPAAQSGQSAQPAGRAAQLHQVVLPDLFAAAPGSITAAQLASLARLRYVRKVMVVDGGAVKINGHRVNIIGVNPVSFRSWAPPQTATMQSLWTALSRGEFATSAAAGKLLRLRTGASYRVSAASQSSLRFGGTAAIGVPGVDAVVGAKSSAKLGLVPGIGVLISAPGASLASLMDRVRAVLGNRSQVISLRPSRQLLAQGKLPVDSNVPGGRPTSYLQLFRASAKLYCPGLSWTVLAAIGQIESGDGQNMGPSSAGALGPMQFLPSTWRIWGIDAFGQTGPPDIMNPYDAVPAAADYLCASGAGSGGAALSAAIFSYNHAAWYVAEVLALAHQYALVYG